MPRPTTRTTPPPPGHRRTRPGRRARLLITVLVVLPLAVSGCSMQPLSMSRPIGTSAGTSANAAAKTKVRASPAPAPATSGAATSASAAVGPPLVRGALATGSIARTLAVAGRTLLIDYWTSQPAATWTSNHSVAINASAHMKGSDTRHAVLVTHFRATLDVDASAQVSVLRDDSGRFVMTPPYSYGTTLLMPAQPATARAATITVEFDLLIETVPGSGQYYRQTVLDSLQLTFVPATQGTSL